MSHEDGFAVDLVLEKDFRFAADFGLEGAVGLAVDEPPPLGEGAGPNAARLLAAAVGHCMSASLLFCLRRSRVEVEALHTRVEGTLVRNESGRLRIGSLRVHLQPQASAEDRARMARCMEVFEEYCIVGQSVRGGIPLDVEVDPTGVTAGAA